MMFSGCVFYYSFLSTRGWLKQLILFFVSVGRTTTRAHASTKRGRFFDFNISLRTTKLVKRLL